MKPVEWEELSKEELILVLEQLEKHALPAERLMVGDDVVYPKRCDCMPEEEPLPEPLRQLRERVAKRRKVERKPSIFSKILRRPPAASSQKKRA